MFGKELAFSSWGLGYDFAFDVSVLSAHRQGFLSVVIKGLCGFRFPDSFASVKLTHKDRPTRLDDILPCYTTVRQPLIHAGPLVEILKQGCLRSERSVRVRCPIS